MQQVHIASVNNSPTEIETIEDDTFYKCLAIIGEHYMYLHHCDNLKTGCNYWR